MPIWQISLEIKRPLTLAINGLPNVIQQGCAYVIWHPEAAYYEILEFRRRSNFYLAS